MPVPISIISKNARLTKFRVSAILQICCAVKTVLWQFQRAKVETPCTLDFTIETHELYRDVKRISLLQISCTVAEGGFIRCYLSVFSVIHYRSNLWAGHEASNNWAALIIYMQVSPRCRIPY